MSKTRLTVMKRWRDWIAGVLLLSGLYWISLKNYLLFHSLAETFSILIAFALFVIYWNAKNIFAKSYLVFLSTAYFFVGGLDLLHMLSYKGMGVFLDFDANLPTQLWIAARYMESISLLVATFYLKRKVKSTQNFFVYAGVFTLIVLSILLWRIFPTCFIEGVGLTRFKVISEYIISFILLATLTRLYQKRNYFDKEILKLLMLAILVTIGGELAFTFYIDVFGFSNFVGHIFKIVSFYLIYQALVETGLGDPFRLLFRDLKEREKELSISEARYRQIFETNQAVKLIIDPETGMIVDANKAAIDFYGYSAEKIRNLRIFDINALSDEDVQTEMEEAVRAKKLFFEFSHQLASGEVRNVEVYSGPIIVDEKTFLYSIVFDVTERKRAEETIRESAERFRALFESSPVGIGVADQEGNLLLFNKAMLAPGGYSAEDIQETGNVSLLYRNINDHKESIRRFQQDSFVRDFPTQFIRKDGSYYDALLSLAPIRFGGQSCIQAIVQDVTESKHANEMLMESERKLSMLMSNLPGMAYRCKNDASWTMEFISDGCEILTGYRAEDLLCNANISYGEVVAPEDRDMVWTNVQNALSNRSDFQITYRIFTAAGDEKWVWEKGQGVFDQDGELIALEGFITDINDRKKAEDEILKYNKRLDALLKIDQAIINSFDLRVTLNIILDYILSHLQLDAAAVLTHDENTHSLNFVQGVGFQTQALQNSNPRIGHGHAGMVALHRRSIQISNLPTSDYSLLNSPEFDAEGFIAYYGVPLLSKGTLVGVLETFKRSEMVPDTEWVKYLELLASQAAIAIDNISLFENLERSNTKLMHAYDATIEGWASALELRDMETEGHSRRVVNTTIALAKMLGVSGSDLTHVQRGALLHDIGKMGVPDSILQKPGPLTEDEWAIMKQHPALSHKWLASIDYLRPALDIPYCHHEKWDGTGYPRGLKGEQIPLAARFFAVVDVWDALLSDRPYRKAWAREKALAYIKEQAGAYFDPKVVVAFLKYIEAESEA